MATKASCISIANLRVARITRTDNCGRPIPDADPSNPQNSVVFDGFSEVTFTFELSEGAEIEKKKANGQICISRKQPDVLKYVQSEFTFCELHSAAVAIMNPTWAPVTNDAEDANLGFRIDTKTENDKGFALELWADVAGDTDACSGAGAEGQWEYILIPFMQGGTMGDLEFGEEGADFVFTSRSRTGSHWGVGPYDIRHDGTGQPAPLKDPIGLTEPVHFETVTLAPPEPACEFQSVPEAKTPLDQPDKPTVDGNIDADGFSVTWTAVDGAADGVGGYIVKATPQSGGQAIEGAVTNDATNPPKAVFTGLNPQTKYDVTVVAVPADTDANTRSPKSEPLVVTTAPSSPSPTPLPKPAKPTQGSAAPTKDTIKIKWAKVTGAKTPVAQGYTVNVTPTGGTVTVDGTDAAPSATATGLTADTNYTFTVVAHPANTDENTDSPASDPLALKTAAQ